MFEFTPQVIDVSMSPGRWHLRNHIAVVTNLDIKDVGEFYVEAIIGPFKPFRIPLKIKLKSA
jgi:hypothetical protein